MNQQSSEEGQGSLAPKQQTLLRSSVLMASGTLVSRVLGFVRSALLVAVLGVTAGAADSFTIANTLPNMVYNLLAAGIIDAILIPQIVRALKGRSGSEYVNKLLTAAGSLLFGLTVVSMLAIPVIIAILAPTLTPEMHTLTITFAIICVPQIFFYGVYNLLGEVLNARGIFGPYMWAPVINNVVGIASLGLFLYLWGPSGDIRPAESMTAAQIAVVAGLSTVGVIAQALWLLIPMRKSGLKLRLDFNLKGTDFGSASKVAWWTFATLLVSQVGVISTSNLASRAGAFAQETGEIVAGTTAYQYAFMIYMVPQSLIAVTLATAIFTRFANDMADGNMRGVARNFHRGVELIMLLSFFVAAVLAVTATPVMQMIMPTFSPQSAQIYGNVLLALIFALPSTGMVLMSQRVFFAMENAKPVFLMGIVPTILQLLVGWGMYFMLSAQWWTIGASLGETVCRVVQGFISIVWVSRIIPQINVGRLVGRYIRFATAFAVSGGVGWLVMRILGSTSTFVNGWAKFFDSAWKVTLVAIVVAVVYFGILLAVDPEGTKKIFGALVARVRPRAGTGEVLDPGVEVDTEEELEGALDQENRGNSDYSDAALATGMLGGGVRHHFVNSQDWANEPPEWDHLLLEQGAANALSRSMSTPDSANTGAIPVLSGALPVLPRRANVRRKARAEENPIEEVPGSGGNVEPVLDARSSVAHGNQEVNMGKASGRSNSDNSGRFDPTIPALIFGVLIVVVAGAVAFKNLWPKDAGDLFAEISPTLPQSSQSEGEDVVEETPAPEVTPEAAPPVISGATIFSWGNDDGDHPELATALLDSDPSTIWRSRYFTLNQFSEGSEISILLSLAEPAVVSEVAMNFIGSGGEVSLRDASGGDPRTGAVLAVAPITPDTVIKLPQPTEMSAVGLVFNTLPTDDEGMYRAKVTEISIR